MKQRKRKRSFQDYGPINNPLSPNTELIETYGDDYKLVIAQHKENPRKLWTVVDCDGKLIVVAGYHYVNRLNYIITTHEWEHDAIEYIY